ncbi:uncharacterized protein N0V96_003632 [Colletotrichum fioriniae]|uniref:uncharacterized protein n=1 Tax=Colletotrichum fioriniae TaxID=710243 RepID=UPI0032DB64B7|nr:hypothetical protein N0V96_003632 [Colletotrichum fioriniae]
MAFGMCDPGEGIMVITPTYMMFPHDLCARAGVSLIKVNPESIESQFDEQSAPLLIEAMSRVHAAALEDGIVPKALLLCNPSNPCGRTYPRTTLVEIARFCGQKKMHLLSDEIYAMSTFTATTDTDGQALPPFTSVLSIQDDPPRGVLAENIHCMYGASKDFGCGGLRLGFLVTRNELLWRSLRRLVLFTWVSSFSTAFFTHFLVDEQAVGRYLKTYRERLEAQYRVTTQLLKENGIPFVPANTSPGTYILTGSADRNIRLYNPASHNQPQRYGSAINSNKTPGTTKTVIPEGRLIQTYTAHGYEVLDLSVSSDNERFASVGGDRAAFLWDVTTAKTIRRFGGNAHGHTARVNCVSFAGDGDSLVISGGFDTSVRVWDAKSNSAKPIQVLDEAKDAITALAVRDAEVIAGSVDGRVRSYDVRMGRCVTDVIGASVTSLKLTRDGKAMLVGSLDSKIRLMDRESGTCLKTYADDGWRSEELRVQAVLGGKEKYVIAGDELTAGTGPTGLNGDGKIWAWDLLTGKLVATVRVPCPEGYEPKKRMLGKDGKEKERSNVISCVAWRGDGWGDQFCVGGTSGIATVFGSL